jgi:RNA polymerase sigma-70 factor (ECF subfamily)
VDLDGSVADLAPRLLRYCLVRTGDRSAAEDIAQDSLAALIGRWQSYGPPQSPEAFVFAIARRRAWRYSVARRLRAPLDIVSRDRDPGPNPEANAIGRDVRDRVLNAIRNLPPRDREALVLVVAAGLEPREGARAIGISPVAFRMRLSRARRRLAEALDAGRLRASDVRPAIGHHQ